MSNYLALATVTKALKGVLENNTPPDVKIAVGRPTATLGDQEQLPGANIFLFQVTPNAALWNDRVPTRRTDGSLLQRPQSALVLHYLISVWGSGREEEKDLKAQSVLAAIIRKLDSQPLLTRKNIEDALVSDGTVASNLADQLEQVKFTMKTLSLEDMSKLWSVFFQVPYFLSIAYEASVVLIEADETPQQALPVLERHVYVDPFHAPVIDAIIAKGGTAGDPILPGSQITIQGRNLRGDSTFVLIDGSETAPDDVTNSEIACTLPATLYAGIHALQISQKKKMGKTGAETLHNGIESSSTSFILTPQITATNSVGGANPRLDVTCNPAVRQNQRVLVFLNEPGGAKNFSLPSEPFADGATTISFKTSGVDAGTYLVRIQIDGAESRLGLDSTTKKFNSPTVTIA